MPMERRERQQTALNLRTQPTHCGGRTEHSRDKVGRKVGQSVIESHFVSNRWLRIRSIVQNLNFPNRLLKSRVREIRTLGSVRGLPLSLQGRG